MKRAISLTLALLLCLSLCACGKKEASDIAPQLEGTWSSQDGQTGLRFSNIHGNTGDVKSFMYVLGSELGNPGTFEIWDNNTIDVHYPKEGGKSVDSTFKYILEGGTITGIEFGDEIITKE